MNKATAGNYSPNDEKYMQRCLYLAQKGLGLTYPNPLVGSVIVYNGRVIGEGWHRKAGEAHAEVHAIDSVKEADRNLLTKATLYVNLEPCAHHGKTPPCSDLIVRTGIPNVVVAVIDSFSEVAGKGIEHMQNFGVNVKVGLLQNEARLLNRRFFTFHEKKRPYIILKWAQTIDGYTDIIRKKDTPVQPYWITNKLSRTVVHKWRSEEAAIMVGTNTAEKDNPKLNVRDWSGSQPLRLFIDRKLRLPSNLNLTDGSQPTVCFTEIDVASTENIRYVKLNFEQPTTQPVTRQIMNYLYANGLQTVFVEGGTQLINSLYNTNLWDEARVFVGNKFFRVGTKAPNIKGELIYEEQCDDSHLYVFYKL